ncbi:hypothetical protein PM082_014749 [Marasmius tenuissimus]|nr:hypothetical protein PM082_014749 [Marasmius tenuissimus]
MMSIVRIASPSRSRLRSQPVRVQHCVDIFVGPIGLFVTNKPGPPQRGSSILYTRKPLSSAQLLFQSTFMPQWVPRPAKAEAHEDD